MEGRKLGELIKQRKAEDIIGSSNYAKNLRAFLKDAPAHGFYVIGGPKSSGKKFVAEVLLSKYSQETGIKTHKTMDELLEGIISNPEDKNYGNDYGNDNIAIEKNVQLIIDRILESPEPFLRLAEQRSFGFHETFIEVQEAFHEMEGSGRLFIFIDETYQYPYLQRVVGRSIGMKTKAIEERIEDTADFVDFFKKKELEPLSEVKRAIREKITRDWGREIKISSVRFLVEEVERFVPESKVNPRMLAMILSESFLQKQQINLDVEPVFNEETAIVKVQKLDKPKELETPKNNDSRGIKLRKLREELGITQREVGEMAGVTNLEISRAETDKAVSEEKWAKIIVALKTHPKIKDDKRLKELEETLRRD